MIYQRLFKLSALFVVIMFSLQGCNPYDSAGETSGVPSVDEEQPDPYLFTFASLNAEVVQSQCASCHTGPSSIGGVDLSTFQNIINSGTVVAGNALGSTFFTEIESGEMPPQPLDSLSPDLIERVRVWINRGAQENIPPIVENIANKTALISDSSANFFVQAADPERGALGYSWTQVSGPQMLTLSGQTTNRVIITNLQLGAYQFQVVVTDDFGDTTTATATLSITEGPNQPPIVNPGTNQQIVLPVNSVTLMASATDSDGTVASFSWAQSAGPSVATLSGQATDTLMASDLIEGIYTFQVTVTDDDGAASVGAVNVGVARATPSFTAMKAAFLDAKCMRCHMNGNSLGGYELNTRAQALVHVIPGEPNMSSLYLRTANQTMPPANAPETALSAPELADLRLWIERGAPDN